FARCDNDDEQGDDADRDERPADSATPGDERPSHRPAAAAAGDPAARPSAGARSTKTPCSAWPTAVPETAVAASASNRTARLPGASQYSAFSGTNFRNARCGEVLPSGNAAVSKVVHSWSRRASSLAISPRPDSDT